MLMMDYIKCPSAENLNPILAMLNPVVHQVIQGVSNRLKLSDDLEEDYKLGLLLGLVHDLECHFRELLGEERRRRAPEHVDTVELINKLLFKRLDQTEVPTADKIEKIVRPFVHGKYRFCDYLLRQDMIEESVTTVIRKLSNYRRESSFRSWVRGVSNFVCLRILGSRLFKELKKQSQIPTEDLERFTADTMNEYLVSELPSIEMELIFAYLAPREPEHLYIQELALINLELPHDDGVQPANLKAVTSLRIAQSLLMRAINVFCRDEKGQLLAVIEILEGDLAKINSYLGIASELDLHADWRPLNQAAGYARGNYGAEISEWIVLCYESSEVFKRLFYRLYSHSMITGDFGAFRTFHHHMIDKSVDLSPYREEIWEHTKQLAEEIKQDNIELQELELPKDKHQAFLAWLENDSLFIANQLHAHMRKAWLMSYAYHRALFRKLYHRAPDDNPFHPAHPFRQALTYPPQH